METTKILVIEDDYIVARTIERSLRSDNFCIITASRGDKGLCLARQEQPDLIILDVLMPDMDGYAVCREIRADARLVSIPVLFLTAKVKAQDKIAGFNAGGDDYLCKPFNVDELILRVRAILRRTHPRPRLVTPRPRAEAILPKGAPLPSHCLMVGNYILDTRSYELYTPKRGKVRLTPLQYDLLYHLMTHPGEPFSPARLLDEVWDYPSGKGSPDLVRVHIKTLRERIENDPRIPTFICTVPGRGYTINACGQRTSGDLPESNYRQGML
jgi:DNA-binding response OmpR family regulator